MLYRMLYSEDAVRTRVCLYGSFSSFLILFITQVCASVTTLLLDLLVALKEASSTFLLSYLSRLGRASVVIWLWLFLAAVGA